MYGPEYSLNEINYLKCRVIPKLISNYSKSFHFKSCRFKTSQNKRFTSRVKIALQFNMYNVFTIETSFGIFRDKDN